MSCNKTTIAVNRKCMACNESDYISASADVQEGDEQDFVHIWTSLFSKPVLCKCYDQIVASLWLPFFSHVDMAD